MFGAECTRSVVRGAARGIYRLPTRTLHNEEKKAFSCYKTVISQKCINNHDKLEHVHRLIDGLSIKSFSTDMIDYLSV